MKGAILFIMQTNIICKLTINKEFVATQQRRHAQRSRTFSGGLRVGGRWGVQGGPGGPVQWMAAATMMLMPRHMAADRKSTRLNSSHLVISYAVFCLKKKKKTRSKRYLTLLLSQPDSLFSVEH